MITVMQRGMYRLIETKSQTKILILDGVNTYAWITALEIGEILVSSHKSHREDCVLATGNYRLYRVQDEPKLTDQIHLELHVGCNTWQGYLLPTGLPTDEKKRNRIIPTAELISTFNEVTCPQDCVDE
jgi:hypothetical protein